MSDFLFAIEYEVYRARMLFPSNVGVSLALGEEVGEVYRAYLAESREDIKKEAVQACAMLIRMALEGDPSYIEMRKNKKLDR